MSIILKEVTYSPLSQNKSYKANFDGGFCSVKSENDLGLKARVVMTGPVLKMTDVISNGDTHSFAMVALEYLLGHFPELQLVELETSLENLGKTFSRSEFFQLPFLWHHKSHYHIPPEKWSETDTRKHPVRPAPHQGVIYKRYIPHLEKTITYRLIDLEKDLDTFHLWHNQSRVSFFWELNKPKEELRDYIVKGLKDPHQHPIMVEIDGDPVGYYELYWVREDRLGPYYESDAFDRGFHFLIGNKNYLGHKTTDSIIKCGLHLMFLDDARTRRIMAEPRHDNQKVLKYAEASIGWRKVKIFDFPHKRSWLLENSREIFFEGNAL